MMRKSDLVKTNFAKIVKKAIEDGELGRRNAMEWVTKYNSGFYDKGLYEEVKYLINYFQGPVDWCCW